jgi:hypothetical protein
MFELAVDASPSLLPIKPNPLVRLRPPHGLSNTTVCFKQAVVCLIVRRRTQTMTITGRYINVRPLENQPQPETARKRGFRKLRAGKPHFVS